MCLAVVQSSGGDFRGKHSYACQLLRNRTKFSLRREKTFSQTIGCRCTGRLHPNGFCLKLIHLSHIKKSATLQADLCWRVKSLKIYKLLSYILKSLSSSDNLLKSLSLFFIFPFQSNSICEGKGAGKRVIG